jgi:hypothetical protein
MSMAAGTVESVQERLFAYPDMVNEERERMRGFIAEETLGTDISCEAGCLDLVDVLAIAAESLAQTIAESRGGVDPGSEEFLSENLLPRINWIQVGEPGVTADLIFARGLAFDPDVDLLDKGTVTEDVVTIVENAAFGMAEILVNEQAYKNHTAALVEAI